MNLEQKILKCLVDHVGGKQKDVKDVSPALLSRMSKGTSGISTRKLKEIMKANNMSGELVIYGSGTKTTINFFE